MVLLALFAALIALRISCVPEARFVCGALVMAFGIWFLLGATGVDFVHAPFVAPRLLGMLLGVWLVVKGALRLSYY